MQLENSTKYHPTAKPMVENAVQRVLGPTRVLKGALETNIKVVIRPNTPVMTLMVSHAASIINRISKAFCSNVVLLTRTTSLRS